MINGNKKYETKYGLKVPPRGDLGGKSLNKKTIFKRMEELDKDMYYRATPQTLNHSNQSSDN